MDLLFLLFFPSTPGPAEETMRLLRPTGPASNEDAEVALPSEGREADERG